jgi:hypothetical protein
MNYSDPEKTANSAAASYNLDPVWYADSAATDHITGDLNKLTMKENYSGQDQAHATNDTGMTIKHIGHSTVSTPYRHILLKNVLHVPQATHNLVFGYLLWLVPSLIGCAECIFTWYSRRECLYEATSWLL